MTVLDEIFSLLAGTLGQAPTAFTGTVVDGAGIPLPGAAVAAVRSGGWRSRIAAVATTDAAGRFALAGRAGDHVLVTAAGVSRTVVPAAPPADLGAVTVLVPVVLSASVGVEGTNRPLDVRRLQARMHRLGRLTDAEVAAEPVDLAAVPPMPLGPALLRAFTDHLRSRLGRLPARVELGPDDPLDVLINADPPVPLVATPLATPVGSLPGDAADAPINRAASVAAVQRRLVQLGLLRQSEYLAENAVAAGRPDPTVAAPATFAAVTRLAREIADTSLTAVVPGTVLGAALTDPPAYGRRPVVLGAGVGTGAANRPGDVLAVQRRLVELGHLSEPQAAAEEPDPGAGPVREVGLTATIAAIGALQAARLGAAGPAPAVLPTSAAVRRLEYPLQLQVADAVELRPDGTGTTPPATIRTVQERLLLLNALTRAEYDAEDPYLLPRTDAASLPRTVAALQAVTAASGRLGLTGPVGRGVAAARADVRRVQDRLAGLRFLAKADSDKERVDPAGTGTVPDAELTATYAALSAFRRRVLDLPADDPAAPWSAQPVVRPGDDTDDLLADPLTAGRRPLRLLGSVGALGGNFPDDVRAVQARLVQARLLNEADAAAEAVPAAQVGRVADAALPLTRAAIARLSTAFLASPAPAPERIEPASEELRALDDPFGVLITPLSLTSSVGSGQENLGADVRALQSRLVGLGFLSPAAAERERVAAVNVPVPSAVLPATVAALGRFRRLMLGRPDAVVEPLSEEEATLQRPATPREVVLPLTAAVGAGRPNLGRDVRTVQDRLFELGVLGAEDYARELAPRGPAAVPPAGLAATLAAIIALQRTLAGMTIAPPDGRIDVGGRAQRVLERVAGSSPTAANPLCTLTTAGPLVPPFAANVQRVIRAVEAVEGGIATGEIPAILRNASRMPASFGRAQVIGDSAVRTLQRPVAAPLAAYYGLTPAILATMRATATAAEAAFNAVSALMPAAVSEAVLRGRIADRVRDHGAQIRADAGLGPLDIERMFRAAQLRRHLLALPPASNPLDLFNAGLHPAAATNLGSLALAATDVQAYYREPRYFGEHRQGFVTLALFRTPQGQRLRQVLTDDSGSKLGRVFVADNHDATAGNGLTDRQRAQVTAYLHNHGGTVAWAVANLGEVAADAYVVDVTAWWDAHP